jgi:hypothetical protein
VAQARRIDVGTQQVAFTFSPAQRTLLATFEQTRPWLEEIAQRLAPPGAKPAVTGTIEELVAGPTAPAAHAAGNGAQRSTGPARSLREQALADAGVKALLEVFPAEIRDVEEMEP